MLTRRRFLQATMAAAGVGIPLAGYATAYALHDLEFVHRNLPVRGLPSGLIGRRLVQLSDVHAGLVDERYLFDSFARVNALAPDLVVYTGDFISYRPNLFDDLERLFATAPHGRLATLGTWGNHDYGPGWAHPEIAARLGVVLERLGIRILSNTIADVDGLQVVGLDDLWAHRFDATAALASLDRQRAAIALSHNPDTADRAGWDGFAGWILAGHTHGGQVRPPFLPPLVVPVENRRYTAGVFDLPGDRRLYISRGLGHWLPVRFNVRPEVTVFTLQRA